MNTNNASKKTKTIGRRIHMQESNPLYDSEKYYKQRERFEKTLLSKLSLSKRQKIYPILRTIIKVRNKLNGYKIKCIGAKRTQTDKPKIFSITHIGKLAIETVITYIKDHFVLLTGDFENLYGTVDGTFLMLNGCVFVRKDDAVDRHLSKEKMISVLKSGGNLMWFPEGVWNLSPNLPVLQMPYGIIDVAQQADAVIIPIGIEEYGKDFIVNIGENFYVSKNKDDLISEIHRLRDCMATLKYEIWESVPPVLRSQLPKFSVMEESFLTKQFSQWTLSKERIFSWIFKPKDIITFDEVYNHLGLIKPNLSNAFLFNKR